MANFLDKKIVDTENEDICSLVTKYNALIDQINAMAVTTDGKQVLADFFLRSPELVNTRWHEFRIELDKLYIGSNSDGDDPKGLVLDATLARISPDTTTKIGYFLDTTLRLLSALSDREFLAKGHIPAVFALQNKTYDEYTGINPTTGALELDDAFQHFITITANLTSTTASIELGSPPIGGGIVDISFYNNSASSVAFTINSSSTLLFSANLTLARASNVVTIPANKIWTITAVYNSEKNTWRINDSEFIA